MLNRDWLIVTAQSYQAATVTSSLHKLLADGTVRYSQVWEDHDLVTRGLEVGPEDDVLSIASGGCNALALLLREPKSVTAIDLNPAQVALVELKLRAIEALEWEDFVSLVGVAPHADRLSLYDRVRPRLGGRARAYWDSQGATITAGIHWSGRLEAFFRGFHAGVLPKVHAPELLARFLDLSDPAAQARLFDTAIGSPELKSAFTAYFTRERLASEGRDPRQMIYVDAMDVSGFFWERFRWVLTTLPARGNFYVHSFLTGRYADPVAVPPYLQRANYPRLRALLPRMRVELTDVESALRQGPPSRFSKANLSDLFEYLSDEGADALFDTLGERLRPGGRACFWNLLVPRESGAASAHLRPMRDLARDLYAHDRSWFYRAFHIEEVSR